MSYDPNCRRCDLDLHYCYGCGERLDHSRGVCGPCMTGDDEPWGDPSSTATPRERLYDPDTLRDAYKRLEAEGVGEPRA